MYTGEREWKGTMTTFLKSMIACACAGLLLTGCAVRVDVNGHTTDVEVKAPQVTVSVPGASGGNPGTVPVDLAVPSGMERLEVRLGQAIGNVSVDAGGSSALSGQVSYWKTAPQVSTDKASGRLTIRIPMERNVSNNGSPIPDTVLHVGTKLPVGLEVESNMGDVRLNLSELNVTGLKVRSLMGNVTLSVPAGANVRLFYKANMGNNNLAQAGFTKNGDYWLSPGFKTDKVMEVSIESSMGDFRITR